MNIWGAIAFILIAGAAGLFAILGLTSEVTILQTEGQIMEGTTWDEREGSREECQEMGYYYDEYGEEYEECEEYRTVYYFVCSSNINFNYTLADEANGQMYENRDTLTWGETSASCLEEIQNAYPVDGRIVVYYLDNDVANGQLTEPMDPSGFFLCCAVCFGILSIPALIFMLTKRSPGVNMKTGGMIGGLGPQRVSMAPPVDYQAGSHGQQGVQNTTPQYSGGTQAAGMGRTGFGGGAMMMGGGMGAGAGYAAPMQQQGYAQQRGGARRPSKKSKNSHSPSRIAGYKSVISKMNMSKGVSNVYDAENMLRSSGFMNASAANKFMAHPYVLKSMGLTAATSAGVVAGNAVANQNTPMLNPADPATNLRPAGNSDDRLKKMEQEAAAFFESAKPKVNTTTSRPVAKDESKICAHASCSTEVSAFDFRCFDCRKRFCSVHKGMTFQCDSCAK
jgi:hypothetical protein